MEAGGADVRALMFMVGLANHSHSLKVFVVDRFMLAAAAVVWLVL